MEQTELDWTRQHARHTDPGTSREAAASMRSGAEAHARAIYWCLMADRGNGLTAEEIGDRTGMTLVQVARRLPDLRKVGVAEPTNERRKNRSGRSSRVWKVRGCQ